MIRIVNEWEERLYDLHIAGECSDRDYGQLALMLLSKNKYTLSRAASRIMDMQPAPVDYRGKENDTLK